MKPGLDSLVNGIVKRAVDTGCASWRVARIVPDCTALSANILGNSDPADLAAIEEAAARAGT
jgi:hypothetical protein